MKLLDMRPASPSNRELNYFENDLGHVLGDQQYQPVKPNVKIDHVHSSVLPCAIVPADNPPPKKQFNLPQRPNCSKNAS